MSIRHRFVVALAVALAFANPALFPLGLAAGAPPDATASASTDWEGLVQVKSRRFDAVYVLPGADFRGYTKVMLDPTQVAFAPNWMRDINPARMELNRRTSSEDAERIAAEARSGFGDIFAGTFKRAGWEIVTAPGADVLRVSPRVINLFINAPENTTTSLRTRVYTVDAGEATLALEVRDSTTGALLGRAVDRRTAGDRGNFASNVARTSTVSNRGDFEALFDTWARTSVAALDELKAQSPVATTARAPKP